MGLSNLTYFTVRASSLTNHPAAAGTTPPLTQIHTEHFVNNNPVCPFSLQTMRETHLYIRTETCASVAWLPRVRSCPLSEIWSRPTLCLCSSAPSPHSKSGWNSPLADTALFYFDTAMASSTFLPLTTFLHFFLLSCHPLLSNMSVLSFTTF